MAQGGRSGRGRRDLAVRVKSARGRKPSSTRWLQRQLNDPYVQRAREEGYRGRAAYKLIELDERHTLLAPGARVVDLGAAPGAWAQVAARRVNADASRGGRPRGRVLGIDVLDMEPLPAVETHVLDFLEEGAEARLTGWLDGPADVVLSDMAAPATGHRPTDHLRVVALAEAAAEFAVGVLAPGGAFVSKVLDGGAEAGLQGELKRRFARVANVKPPASRPDSAEKYVVATGFRG